MFFMCISLNMLIGYMYFVHVYLTSRTIERLPGTRYKFYTRNDVGRRYIYLLPTLPTYGVLTLIFPFSYSKLKTTRRPLPNRPTEHNAHAHTYIAHITFATLCLSCLVCRGRGRGIESVCTSTTSHIICLSMDRL